MQERKENTKTEGASSVYKSSGNEMRGEMTASSLTSSVDNIEGTSSHLNNEAPTDSFVENENFKKIPEEWKELDQTADAMESITDPLMTISKQSIADYSYRASCLVTSYMRESGNEIEDEDIIDPVDLINWLFSRKQELRSSTWRSYRTALRYYVIGLSHSNAEKAISMLDGDFTEPGKRKLDKKTSALKSKKFPYGDFNKVLKYLEYFDKSKFRNATICWLKAGVFTGLRPVEWRATRIKIVNNKKFLLVLNAKATNGRAHGILRHLEITNMDPEQIQAITEMSEMATTWFKEGSFNERKAQISKIIYKVVKKLFPGKKQHYCLYSLRHQFIANAKSQMPLEKVSALVGHGVTSTTASRYGKKREAWGGGEIPKLPKALDNEVRLVTDQHVYFAQRMKMKKEAGLIAEDASETFIV